MNYWLVFKIENGRRIYVSETDEFGYPRHTDESSNSIA